MRIPIEQEQTLQELRAKLTPYNKHIKSKAIIRFLAGLVIMDRELAMKKTRFL
jgi:hypothetical protein